MMEERVLSVRLEQFATRFLFTRSPLPVLRSEWHAAQRQTVCFDWCQRSGYQGLDSFWKQPAVNKIGSNEYRKIRSSLYPIEEGLRSIRGRLLK